MSSSMRNVICKNFFHSKEILVRTCLCTDDKLLAFYYKTSVSQYATVCHQKRVFLSMPRYATKNECFSVCHGMPPKTCVSQYATVCHQKHSNVQVRSHGIKILFCFLSSNKCLRCNRMSKMLQMLHDHSLHIL